MTRVGIVSDIHGNHLALRAVLQQLERRGVDRVVCLGDVVGYNPDGDACVDVLRGARIETVAGNHDLIAIGRLGTDRCSDKPAFALRRARRDLSAASRRFLGELPGRIAHADTAWIHGGVRDVQLYLETDARLVENAHLLASELPDAVVCFFGHTHVAGAFRVEGRSVVARHEGSRAALTRVGGARWFVNPGAVDASRKPEGAVAECALFDADTRVVEWISVPYDRDANERRARAAGYRMSRVDEWLYRSVRFVRRASNRLTRIVSRHTEGRA
jgi:predicted phosphodiesterase